MNTIKQITTDSFSMNYFSFGTGEKTMVILPGLSIQSVMPSADAIAKQYDIFTKDFTVYVFDRRNELPALYPIEHMAENMAQVFKKLNLSNIYLFGASQGGMIAQVIAINHPELIAKLILGSTTCKVTKNNSINAWIEKAESHDGSGLYLEFGKLVYPEALFQQYHDILNDMGKSVTAEEFERFIILAKATDGFDVTERLGAIKCPVLLLNTSDDKVLGSNAHDRIIEQLKSHKDFEYYIYSGYGHAAYDTAPDYQQRMLDFFTK